MDILRQIDESSLHTNHPELDPGDTVRVSYRVEEGNKSRIQVFEGVVLRVRGGGMGRSFTVRKVSFSIGVERVFPYYSPLVEQIEIVQRAKVRRARLYYLRDRQGRAARLKGRSTIRQKD